MPTTAAATCVLVSVRVDVLGAVHKSGAGCLRDSVQAIPPALLATETSVRASEVAAPFSGLSARFSTTAPSFCGGGFGSSEVIEFNDLYLPNWSLGNDLDSIAKAAQRAVRRSS